MSVGRKLYALALSLAMILAGCIGSPLGVSTPISPDKIPPHSAIEVPPASFDSVAWVDDEKLVLTSFSSQTASGLEIRLQPQIAYVGPNTEFTSIEELARVPLAGLDCVPINEEDVVRAESNTIYYSRVCRYDQHKSRIKSALMHLDFGSNESKLIQQFAFFNGFNGFAIEPDGPRVVFC